MSSTTPRLGLINPDGTDLFQRSDFVSNHNKLDQYPGTFVCTSQTRPVWGANQAGQSIFETDTRRQLWWDGSVWHDTSSSPPAWIFGFQPGYEIEFSPSQDMNFTMGTINVRRAGSLALIGVINAEQNAFDSFQLRANLTVDGVYAGAYYNTPNGTYLNDGMDSSQWHTYGPFAYWDDYRVITIIGMKSVTAGNHNIGVHLKTQQGHGSIVRMSVMAFMVNSTDV